MSARFLCPLLFIICALPQIAAGQDAATQAPMMRDPRATAVADAVLKALAPQTVLADISIEGTVNYTSGGDLQIGTFDFEASGNNKSRVALMLDGGVRQEVRNGPLGSRTDPDGVVRPISLHNCWTDATWYYPALSLPTLANDPQVSIVYGGLEARNGLSLHRLRLYRTVPDQTPSTTADIQRLSMIDILIDASSYLPYPLSTTFIQTTDLPPENWSR